MFQIAHHAEVLSRLGLASMEGVKRFSAELVKNHKGKRDIIRITTERSGLPFSLFLKRNWRPDRRNGFRSLLTRRAVWSESKIEWENAVALEKAGIGVGQPIAFGEECGPFWEYFSFIITAGAGGQTLAEFLSQRPARAARRRIIRALAEFIRRLHDAGFASPDLFARHIFVVSEPLPKFCLIDMARLNRGKPLTPKIRARDLAALNVSVPLRFVTMRERLRFLAEYGGSSSLLALTEKRTRHLLQRRKFASFAAAAPAT